MSNAIYPGTFDPITMGHLDIIERASKLFDQLVVFISPNSDNKSKVCTFSLEERIEFIKKCTAHIPNVKVVSSNGLTVDKAKELNCKVIVRGIRAVTDYEYELAQATSNLMLNSDIETCLFVAKPELSFLSSSIAKEIASFNGDISKFIPDVIAKDVILKLKK